jgi:hypothetical protein
MVSFASVPWGRSFGGGEALEWRGSMKDFSACLEGTKMCRSYWLPLTLVAVCSVGVVPVAALPQEAGLTPAPLRLAREVFLNSSSKLKSGMGKGTFHCYHETSDGATIVYSGKLTSHFKDCRYHIHLEYDDPKKYPERTRRIIICDKSGLFSSDFWEDPRAGVRSEGYVHHAVTDNLPSVAEFPWDLSRPWVSHVDSLLKNIPTERLRFTELAAKGFELRYDVGTGSLGLAIAMKSFWGLGYADLSAKPSLVSVALPTIDRYAIRVN